MSKIAYQFDMAGLFVATTIADESPLEEGVFLLPAGCTFTAPPEELPDGKWPRWNGTAWTMANRPNTSAAEENPLAKLQAFLTANPDVAAVLNIGGV